MILFLLKSLATVGLVTLLSLLTVVFVRDWAKAMGKKRVLLVGLLLSLFMALAANNLWLKTDQSLKVAKLEPYTSIERIFQARHQINILTSGYLFRASAKVLRLKLANGEILELDFDGINLPIGEQVIVWGRLSSLIASDQSLEATLKPEFIHKGSYDSFKARYSLPLKLFGYLFLPFSWLSLLLSPLPFLLALRSVRKEKDTLDGFSKSRKV